MMAPPAAGNGLERPLRLTSRPVTAQRRAALGARAGRLARHDGGRAETGVGTTRLVTEPLGRGARTEALALAGACLDAGGEWLPTRRW
jgi:hypothetical protein